VGETFGALNSVVSGAALAALVITSLMQHKELKSQRAAFSQAEVDLNRTAEANLRMLHVDLIRMAMDDRELAAVWPTHGSGLSEDRNRQYLYANLILQHAWLQLRITDFTEAELQRYLRYLFKSPLLREYMKDRANAHVTIYVPHTAEYRFNQLAEEICAEYESVLACAQPGPTVNESSTRGSSPKSWESIDPESVAKAA
jgi:hypothetical protein